MSISSMISTKRKVPVIYQAEAAECGISCLAMVLNYYGFEVTLNELRKLAGFSSSGANLSDLKELAFGLGLNSRALSVPVEELSGLDCPCILHWGMNHFVVLTGMKNGAYSIIDPSAGAKKVSLDEVKKKFTGIAMELHPTESFEKREKPPTLGVRDFVRSLSGFPKMISAVIFLSLLAQIFILLGPLYAQLVVDDVLAGGDIALMNSLTVLFLIILASHVLTTVFRDKVVSLTSNAMSFHMSASLFSHLIRLPASYFSSRKTGDHISRFESLSRIREILTNGLITAFVDGATAAVTLVVIFFYSGSLALIVIAFTTLYLIVRWALFERYKRAQKELIVRTADEETCFLETVRAIQAIKNFGIESRQQEKWLNLLGRTVNKNVYIDKNKIAFRAAYTTIFGVEGILIVYIAAFLVMSNSFTVGMLLAFISYKLKFTSSVSSLVDVVTEYRLIGLHLERISDITDSEPSSGVPSAGTERSAGLKGSLEVRQLAFRYGKNERHLFQDINFEVRAGECLAIIGPSGHGKSTLMKCLTGTLSPTSGGILVDGRPIEQLASYRSSIGIVLQDDILLTGDIAENISLFESRIDWERIHWCCTVAGIHEEIESFPMGYRSLVGDMGSSLSGGQRQRIILARALYRKPKILFLDEATSHLDVAKEKEIGRRISELEITRIMIAHRPEAIRLADKVMDISKPFKNVETA